MKRICLALLMIMLATPVFPADPDGKTAPVKNKAEDTGYRIDSPGTITFTVGVKIRGKVEKPQVVIFLPKERSYYREMDFSYSYENEITKPLPFTPIIE